MRNAGPCPPSITTLFAHRMRQEDFSFMPTVPLMPGREKRKSKRQRKKDNYEHNLKCFLKFHAANPHVYDALVDRAREEKAEGETRGSIKRIFEHLRKNRNIRTTDQNFPYKLCNTYYAFYAHLIDEQEPDLKGWFKFRKRRSERD